MNQPVFEQEKRVRELEYELGQTKISLDHKTTLLASCEKALEERDAKPVEIPDENHPRFGGFIRAFWRRIEPHKADYGKELPEELPIEFRAHMATALTYFRK